jgi:hypothetical protein
MLDYSSNINVYTNTDIEHKAVQRAINNKRPFHKSKNSIADAIIFEEFAGFVEIQLTKLCERICFVTINKNDFSDDKDYREPHPDIYGVFQKDNRVIYETNIGSLLNTIQANMVSEDTVSHIDKSRTYRIFLCSDGGEHEFVDAGWFPSDFGGGRSWHLRCIKCGSLVDTYDYMCD